MLLEMSAGLMFLLLFRQSVYVTCGNFVNFKQLVTSQHQNVDQ